MPDGFYVYTLWRTDTAEPVPFYVGKGADSRVIVHLMPCARGENAIKDRILTKLAEAGVPPLFTINRAGLSEEEAHEFEADLIRRLGRRNVGSGPLANMTDGGEGMSGHVGRRGGEHPGARAVVAGGRHHRSLADAVRETGLHRKSIIQRIKTGHEGFYYLDEGQRRRTTGNRGDHSKRGVVAEGTEYESLAAAARALGVFSSAIHKRIEWGWTGYRYVGGDQKPRLRPAKRFKVKVAGRVFESAEAAGRALSLQGQTVIYRCRSASFPDYEAA